MEPAAEAKAAAVVAQDVARAVAGEARAAPVAGRAVQVVKAAAKAGDARTAAEADPVGRATVSSAVLVTARHAGRAARVIAIARLRAVSKVRRSPTASTPTSSTRASAVF